MLRSSLLLICFYLLSLTQSSLGHGHFASESDEQLYKRQHHLAHRALDSKCASAIHQRMTRRSLANRRDLSKDTFQRLSHVIKRAESEVSSACILATEVTQGPYHILGEMVRQDITEGQPGINMEVHAYFVDIDTCEPVAGAYVDAWHANSTGYYSGYVAATGSALGGAEGGMGGSGGMGGAGGNSTNSTMSFSGSMPFGTAQSMSMSMSGSASGSASGASATSSVSSPYAGADSSSAASQLDTDITDELDFLRGVYKTDEDGLLTMYSVVPGWYSGRAQHFHIKVYPNGTGTELSNGTFFASGSAVHTGQFFFDNTTLQDTAATWPYNTNSIDWSDAVANDDDQWYPYQNSNGYTADMNVVYKNASDIRYGIIATITVGLNMSYASPELSSQYWNPNNGSTSTSSITSSSSSTSTTTTITTSSS